jgi:hypothetical protein
VDFRCGVQASVSAGVTWTPAFFVKFLWNLAVRLRLQMRCVAKRPNHYFKWRTTWLRSRIAAFCSRKEDRVICDKVDDLCPGSPPDRNLWRTHVRAWFRFVPKPYEGKVVLLRTQGHPLICSYDPQMGWGSFASGGVSVRICQGDHESILEEENAHDAAWHVRAILDEVQTRRQNT